MIAIIKYNGGNTQSVQNALQRLNTPSKVTDDPIEILGAEKVIFPGVGHAQSAMNSLVEKGLDQLIPQLSQPVLGICLGMQLMCEYSEEGGVQGLGIFPNTVRRFKSKKDIIPHMGWNAIRGKGQLVAGIPENSHVYFTHSYYAECSTYTSAICDYIQPFSAALEKDNFFATQFHPEKSSTVGRQILKNFIAL
ncbi:MAG: imidazole glycerol phosphate synthase subunit HisH [Schleiferiaceae bacterium]